MQFYPIRKGQASVQVQAVKWVVRWVWCKTTSLLWQLQHYHVATAAAQLPSGQLHSTSVAGAGNSRDMNQCYRYLTCRSLITYQIYLVVFLSYLE